MQIGFLLGEREPLGLGNGKFQFAHILSLLDFADEHKPFSCNVVGAVSVGILRQGGGAAATVVEDAVGVGHWRHEIVRFGARDAVAHLQCKFEQMQQALEELLFLLLDDGCFQVGVQVDAEFLE